MNAATVQKLKTGRLIALIIMLFGLSLMTYMIGVESELGALPLLLFVVGALWLMVSQYRIRSHRKKQA